MKLEFSRQISERYSNKFHQNPSNRSEVFQCGQTERHEEAHRNFANALQNAMLNP